MFGDTRCSSPIEPAVSLQAPITSRWSVQPADVIIVHAHCRVAEKQCQFTSICGFVSSHIQLKMSKMSEHLFSRCYVLSFNLSLFNLLVIGGMYRVNFHIPSVTHSILQPTTKKYIMIFLLSPHLGICITAIVLLPLLKTYLAYPSFCSLVYSHGGGRLSANEWTLSSPWLSLCLSPF